MASAASAALTPASNTATSLNFLYQNNLNITDNTNHISALLLDTMPYASAEAACASLHETLLTKTALEHYAADFKPQLAYTSNMNYAKGWAYYIKDGIVVVDEGEPLQFKSLIAGAKTQLPVLCTQSGNSTVTSANKIRIAAGGNTYTGIRDQKAFKFLGIPYGNYTERWTHSKQLTATGVNYDSTAAGPICLQYGQGSEYCLYLNIWTPYIPKAGSKANLRPVHFWIHGGGFVNGAGSNSDASDLASREDIVTVTINYRLGTLGFLAVPGVLTGNYGIGDQITALDWVVKNIAKFGGDPGLITINGQSAGAGSVRTLLGSPKAIGKFASAIAMSNLGGGVNIGLSGNYGTTYSEYYTIDQSYAATSYIFASVNCTQPSLSLKVACLRAYKGDFTPIGSDARYVVQDNNIVVTPHLELTKRNPNTAHVPIIFGVTENDGASLNTYNRTCTTPVSCIAADTYITPEWAQRIIDSGLFPYYSTGDTAADSFNVSQRIVTDTTFRCIDQATTYAAATSNAVKVAYYYEAVRTYPSAAYNPNDVNVSGTISPTYPYGNPATPYYKVHSSDVPNIFGGVVPLRDENDLKTLQVTMNYFANFMRTGNPNPETWYLKARNYTDVLKAVQKSGKWNPVTSTDGPAAYLDYPPRFGGFVDRVQCAWLNTSVSFYFDGR
ncbi:hypothetical protein HDV00_000925 [Rhizophlyctis rosea]|nr:hypothetical protein HDV00_000925 [Rhizophlyctis rosea]